MALVLSHANILGAAQNFPVKSVNIANAPTVNFYLAASLESSDYFDIHPVHGAVLADGSYVMAGKSLETDGGTAKRMFCLKLTSTGTLSWAWGTATGNGDDVANAVMQLPTVGSTHGDIIVVGFQTVSWNGKPCYGNSGLILNQLLMKHRNYLDRPFLNGLTLYWKAYSFQKMKTATLSGFVAIVKMDDSD